MTPNRTHRPHSATQAGSALPDRARPVSPLLAATLDAARRRCDDFEDGQAAREAMKRAVLDTRPELLADLLRVLTEHRLTRADFVSPFRTTAAGPAAAAVLPAGACALVPSHRQEPTP